MIQTVRRPCIHSPWLVSSSWQSFLDLGQTSILELRERASTPRHPSIGCLIPTQRKFGTRHRSSGCPQTALVFRWLQCRRGTRGPENRHRSLLLLSHPAGARIAPPPPARGHFSQFSSQPCPTSRAESPRSRPRTRRSEPLRCKALPNDCLPRSGPVRAGFSDCGSSSSTSILPLIVAGTWSLPTRSSSTKSCKCSPFCTGNSSSNRNPNPIDSPRCKRFRK